MCITVPNCEFLQRGRERREGLAEVRAKDQFGEGRERREGLVELSA